MDSTTFYCVGGGPSLIGFDWSRLQDKRCIAINRAYEVLPDAEFVYFTDRRFYEWHKIHLLQHKGRLLLGNAGDQNYDPKVEKYRITGHCGLDTRPGHIRHGNNSGYAAINVAYHLGAKRIVLLGYDMRFAKDGKAHWHDGHPAMNRETSIPKMLMWFPHLVVPLRELRIDVVNANMDSAIECFPKVKLEEVL